MHITPPAKLGLVGLGLIGSALARRFLAAGFYVMGSDPVARCREQLSTEGGETALAPREIFRSCECVVLSLPNSGITLEVLAGISGKESSCRLVIDTTTSSPDDITALAGAADTIGARYIDATISGSSTQVEAGTATVMAGADPESFAHCRAVFAAFSRKAFHTGEAGSGTHMKLVSNLILGLNRAALAEGLHLAQVLGIPDEVLTEVLPQTMAHSAIMDTKLDKMLHDDFTPQARLSQHLKDVRIILNQGQGRTGQFPLSEAHAALLESAQRLGFGEADNSAIRKAYPLKPDDEPLQR